MLSSAFRVLGVVAMFSLVVSLPPAAMASGATHVAKAAMKKANGETAARKKKCSSEFNSQSASVKAKGKKAFMAHCVTFN